MCYQGTFIEVSILRPFKRVGTIQIKPVCMRALLKKANEDVEAVVVQWFLEQPRIFFMKEIHQWDACFNIHGGCFDWNSFPR
jgi:hypothetical protein